MRLYLDLCCLNRPFDDQSQPRVARETAATEALIDAVRSGRHTLVSSEALYLEAANGRDRLRRGRVYAVLSYATRFVPIDAQVARRCQRLMLEGFDGYDALHLASAEAGAALLVTTDDRLQRRAARYPGRAILVRNPAAVWSELQ